MEFLSETLWDVVIVGTGLQQSLLALSLSRSGKKILHVDQNEYYGGNDAAFSLSEAEKWQRAVQDEKGRCFSSAEIITSVPDTDAPATRRISGSRSYTLTLSPQLIYAQSKLLQFLVSSQVHTQLEFQAVGSWWVHTNGRLRKIPSGREDVFNDEELSRRDKVALMKFLRHAVQEEDADAAEEDMTSNTTFDTLLSAKFQLPEPLHGPLLALSLSPLSVKTTASRFALANIKRHMRSIGAFGPGFGAVIPKYGGGAEIAQVSCRACAVGGGVYILGQGIVKVTEETDSATEVELSGGERIKALHVVGGPEDLPESLSQIGVTATTSPTLRSAHSISIVSSQLSHLFPSTSENGPVPAGAVVLSDGKPHADHITGDTTPVYLQAHSEDTGECPPGQCVIYCSTIHVDDDTHTVLQNAVVQLLQTSTDDPKPTVLWSLNYISQSPATSRDALQVSQLNDSKRVMVLPPLEEHLAFDDRVLDVVRTVWKNIMGDEVDEDEFMRFPERTGEMDDNE